MLHPGFFGSRWKCTCCLFLAVKWNVFIGQRAYLALYLVLLFAPTIVLTVAGPWHVSDLAGSPALHFGIFVAFATIYPRVELFLRIMAKWVAVDSRRSLHASVARLSRVGRADGGLDEHRSSIPFH